MKCRTCNEPNADNGEGWDGECGDCADITMRLACCTACDIELEANQYGMCGDCLAEAGG